MPALGELAFKAADRIGEMCYLMIGGFDVQ